MSTKGKLLKIRYGEREVGWAQEVVGKSGLFAIDNLPFEPKTPVNFRDVVRLGPPGRDGLPMVADVVGRTYRFRSSLHYRPVTQAAYAQMYEGFKSLGIPTEGVVPGHAVIVHNTKELPEEVNGVWIEVLNTVEFPTIEST